MGKLVRLSYSIDTVGANGAAVGSKQFSVPGGIGRFIGLSVYYHGTAPGTTDVTIIAKDPDGANVTVYSKADSATSVPFFQTKQQLKDAAGVAIAAEFAHPIVHGSISVSVAQCNAIVAAVFGSIVFETG